MMTLGPKKKKINHKMSAFYVFYKSTLSHCNPYTLNEEGTKWNNQLIN